MLADALRWLDAGFRPIAVRNKRPIEKGWPDLDPERIRRWVAWPGDSIGIVTGNGLAVVDVDPRHGGTLAQLDALGLPPTFGYRTSGGGWHRWYRVDGEVRSSTGTLGTGIDVKGERSYVRVPPSPGYEFDGDSNAPITPLPAAMLLPPARRYAAAPIGAARYGGPPERVAEGGRHDAAVRYAGHLWGTGADEAEVEAALLEWNELACVPPLPDAEILSIVRWVRGRPS